MRETLWIAFPEQEAAGASASINYIDNKDLSSLSVEQPLKRLINNNK